jgi:hypothetical protein
MRQSRRALALGYQDARKERDYDPGLAMPDWLEDLRLDENSVDAAINKSIDRAEASMHEGSTDASAHSQ